MDVDRWKATEYRQFLLYAGKIVLKDILRKDLYDHFMSLSVAITILVSPHTARSHSLRMYAHDLLAYFISQGSTLYGAEFLVYNVHSLVHLTAEVESYGSLDECLAFPFENYLQKIKRMVRTGRNPIAQIVKRLSEVDGLCPGATIVQKECPISTKAPNNAFISDHQACCEVVDSCREKDESEDDLFLCPVYDGAEALFTTPCD